MSTNKKILDQIDISNNCTLIITNWRQVCRGLGIPKSKKRIEKKRLKKLVNNALAMACEKFNEK